MALAIFKQSSLKVNPAQNEWDNELSVDISDIDEQHKFLISLLKELYEVIERGQDIGLAEEVMDKFCESAKKHFTVEESLMRILGYPGYDEHKKAHQLLFKQLQELRNQLRSNYFSIDLELLSSFRKRLTQHIIDEDKNCAPFFVKRGVKTILSKSNWVNRLWQSSHG